MSDEVPQEFLSRGRRRDRRLARRSRFPSPFRCAAVAAALLLLAGCATTPEERAASQRAWAARDAERAAECSQRGGRYIGTSCHEGGRD